MTFSITAKKGQPLSTKVKKPVLNLAVVGRFHCTKFNDNEEDKPLNKGQSKSMQNKPPPHLQRICREWKRWREFDLLLSAMCCRLSLMAMARAVAIPMYEDESGSSSCSSSSTLEASLV